MCSVSIKNPQTGILEYPQIHTTQICIYAEPEIQYFDSIGYDITIIEGYTYKMYPIFRDLF